MKSIRITLIFSSLLTLACNSSSQAPEPTPDDAPYDRTLAEMGAEVYMRRCASCHGEDGRGDGPVAASLRVPPADLTLIAARRDGDFPDGEIARLIDGRFDTPAHGTRDMPVWGTKFAEEIPEAGLSEEISRGKIATLIEFLVSIQRSE